MDLEPNGRPLGSKSIENGKYNLISGLFSKISKIYLCVQEIFLHEQLFLQAPCVRLDTSVWNRVNPNRISIVNYWFSMIDLVQICIPFGA